MTVVEEGQSRRSGRGMLCIGYDGLSKGERLWRMDRVEKVAEECCTWVMMGLQWREGCGG